MCIGCFPAISALMFPLILLKEKTFTALASEVLDKSRPADYNQAIMDFGAVQCTPQSPNCLFCPLSGSCRALSEGKVQQLPVKQHRTKTTNRYFNYIYVRMGAHTLIHKRTEDDIWKNLFELPLVETEKFIGRGVFVMSGVSFRSLQRRGADGTFGASECETCFVSSSDLCQLL